MAKPRETDAAGPVDDDRRSELTTALLGVHGQLDLAGQLDVLLRTTGEWVAAEAAFALAPGEERGRLALFATTAAAGDPRLRSLANLEIDATVRTLGAEPSLHSDAGPLATLAPGWPGSQAGLGVLPVQDATGNWQAVLLLAGPDPAREAEWRRAGELCRQASPAVTNAMRVARLRELVIKDDTARCYNRRYFEEFLPEELARATRFRAPLSLIFLDMDNLKEVNNAHGHPVGSRALTEVSERVRRKIRKFDKLFRFGGDEFCILLPETEWHGAMEVAERVREAVSGQPLLAGELKDGAGISMTASLGIAAYPLHARTQAELVEQADRAMQRIKRGPKNAVAVAEIVNERECVG